MKETFTIVDAQVRDRAAEVVLRLTFDPLHEVVVRVKRKDRSLAQNNTLHMWCGQISQAVYESHGKFYPPEHWKEWLKQLFLGQETIVMGKKTLTRTCPTSKLNVKEFADFLDKIDHYSGSQLGVSLDCISPMYKEAMGLK